MHLPRGVETAPRRASSRTTRTWGKERRSGDTCHAAHDRSERARTRRERCERVDKRAGCAHLTRRTGVELRLHLVEVLKDGALTAGGVTWRSRTNRLPARDASKGSAAQAARRARAGKRTTKVLGPRLRRLAASTRFSGRSRQEARRVTCARAACGSGRGGRREVRSPLDRVRSPSRAAARDRSQSATRHREPLA